MVIMITVLTRIQKHVLIASDLFCVSHFFVCTMLCFAAKQVLVEKITTYTLSDLAYRFTIYHYSSTL